MFFLGLASIVGAFGLAILLLFFFVLRKERRPKNLSNALRPREMVCPFSKDSNFEVEISENAPPSPMELFEDWQEDRNCANSYKPLAAKWLNAGISGQDIPGLLRSGLRRLKNSKFFLLQDSRHAYELSLKNESLDQRRDTVFVAEKDSIEAQRECLELFLDYLPKRYPSLYLYSKQEQTLTISSTNTTFDLREEWIQQRPLELCARIVQEDLVLMRPPCANDYQGHDGVEAGNVDNGQNKTPTTESQSYRMAAAAVVFSFDRLEEKLGQSSQFIHAPVPGFEKHILKSQNLIFSKFKSNQLWWRNNWGLSAHGNLVLSALGPSLTQENPWLAAEYQTLRRLPRSQYILFTIKKFIDPLCELEKVPRAAACLAASIRGMSLALLQYKGIPNPAARDALLLYLDSISSHSPTKQ